MKTLYETIRGLEIKAANRRKEKEICPADCESCCRKKRCLDEAEEAEQLAEWLKDYNILKEKAKEKDVLLEYNADKVYSWGVCPGCGKMVEKEKYCPNCGQKLRRTEE